MIQLWTMLSGKKTVIAAISYAIADIVIAIGYVEVGEGIRKIAQALTFVGLGHKGVKIINK